MQVLKNNYNNNNNEIIRKPIKKLVCENCNSELAYEDNDVRVGALGLGYLDCPCCGYEIVLENSEKEINLTVDNVEFPTHFLHTSADTGAVDWCNNSTIKDAIYKAISFFRKNKDEGSWMTMYGNLCVCVFRFEGDEDYQVIVSNNYYETYIPFEKEDYKVV